MEVAVLGAAVRSEATSATSGFTCWVCWLFGDLGQRDLELVHFQESRAPVILNV